MAPDESKIYAALGTLGLVGLIAGLGALLASKEILTMRIVLGRALSSIALGIAATGVLFIFPDASLYQQIGVACGISSLGTSGLERIVQKWLGKQE